MNEHNFKIGEVVRISDPLPKNITFINKSFEISGDYCDFVIVDADGDILTLQMADDMTTRGSMSSDALLFTISKSDLAECMEKSLKGDRNE